MGAQGDHAGWPSVSLPPRPGDGDFIRHCSSAWSDPGPCGPYRLRVGVRPRSSDNPRRVIVHPPYLPPADARSPQPGRRPIPPPRPTSIPAVQTIALPRAARGTAVSCPPHLITMARKRSEVVRTLVGFPPHLPDSTGIRVSRPNGPPSGKMNAFSVRADDLPSAPRAGRRTTPATKRRQAGRPRPR